MRTDPFRAVAAGYESWYETPLGSHVDSVELSALRRVLTGQPMGFLLEIGAGTGHIARAMADSFSRLIAAEPSAAMRAEGLPRTVGLPIEWVAAVGEALPFRDGVFDGALIVAVLEFVRDPAKVLREAFRVVQPGGWVVVGWLEARSSWTALYRTQADLGVEPWSSARFFTLEQLVELVDAEPEGTESALWAGPLAQPPFDEAEAAGRRAGHPPAFAVARWRVPRHGE